ncbi:hypothetical protein [Novosphingobium sp.]|uniref:hypothetical protein n=1 Tax=Novosphingobium sp. TaxID=1874826 RepID=UPI00261178A8|nr:hypothetical protein [Novosphingobium sp.]
MPEPQAQAQVEALDHAIRRLGSARLATVHPLGFLIVDQAPDGLGGYTRLHLWERTSKSPEIPHSHSGDLRSTVLAGRLTSTPWYPAHHGEPVSVMAVRKNCRNVRRYEYVDSGWMIAGPSRIFGAGECYLIRAGDFHSAECRSPIAITLVERSPAPAERARIAIKAGSAPGHRRMVELAEDLRSAALELLRAERGRCAALRQGQG